MKTIALVLSSTMVLTAVSPSDAKPSRVIPYKKLGDVELTLHIFEPEGHRAGKKTPAIVFFFGGGWNQGTPGQFYPQSEYLASRGMVAICADYRTRSKHKTTPAECVKDGKSAVRWIRAHADELGIDPNKLAAGGGSAGGHIAAAVAAVNGFNEDGEEPGGCIPNALVLFNPVIDNGPGGFGHGNVRDYWEAFSPLHNLHKGMPPTVIFLGTKDHLIPVATAESFRDKLRELGVACDLHLYEGEPHGFFNKNRFAETLIEADRFLASLGYLSGEPTLKGPADGGAA